MFQIEVLSVATQCNVVKYQRFRSPCCFHLQGEDFYMFEKMNAQNSSYISFYPYNFKLF